MENVEVHHLLLHLSSLGLREEIQNRLQVHKRSEYKNKSKSTERSFLLSRVDKTNHNKLIVRQIRQKLDMEEDKGE